MTLQSANCSTAADRRCTLIDPTLCVVRGVSSVVPLRCCLPPDFQVPLFVPASNVDPGPLAHVPSRLAMDKVQRKSCCEDGSHKEDRLRA